MEQVYVIKVRSAPPPLALALPSERRYSAMVVLGISCLHFTLAGLLLILASIRAHKVLDCFWPLVLVTVAGCAVGAAGVLAWKRWYEGVHIRTFFITSTVACLITVAVGLADLLTLPHFGALPFHSILACLLEALLSGASAIVGWHGIKNKEAGENFALPSYKDNLIPVGTISLRKATDHVLMNLQGGKQQQQLQRHSDLPGQESRKEYEERMMSYVSGEHCRPPVEGEEKSELEPDI